MPTSYTTQLGDSLSTIAARELGNYRNWRDIADMNDFTPIAPLPLNQSIKIPEINELQQKALPVLNEVKATIDSNGQQVINVLNQIGTIIPGAKGYSAIAQQALADVNGVLGQVASVLNSGTTLPANRQYDGTPKVVRWLLSGDSTIAPDGTATPSNMA